MMIDDGRRVSMASRSRTRVETSEEFGGQATRRQLLLRENTLISIRHPFAKTPRKITQVADELLLDDEGEGNTESGSD